MAKTTIEFCCYRKKPLQQRESPMWSISFIRRTTCVKDSAKQLLVDLVWSKAFSLCTLTIWQRFK